MAATEDQRQMFGRELRAVREAKNLTAAALAATLGVTGQAINDWENGKYAPRTLARVRELEVALGLRPDSLAALLGFSPVSLVDRLDSLSEKIDQLVVSIERLIEIQLRDRN